MCHEDPRASGQQGEVQLPVRVGPVGQMDVLTTIQLTNGQSLPVPVAARSKA